MMCWKKLNLNKKRKIIKVVKGKICKVNQFMLIVNELVLVFYAILDMLEPSCCKKRQKILNVTKLILNDLFRTNVVSFRTFRRSYCKTALRREMSLLGVDKSFVSKSWNGLNYFFKKFCKGHQLVSRKLKLLGTEIIYSFYVL
jgi:hypothetical protein